jgi:hypothetical protein
MGYRRTGADMTRAPAAEMRSAAGSTPAAAGMSTATAAGMTAAATTVPAATAATGSGMSATAAAFCRGGRVGRSRQRRCKKNDKKFDFKSGHDPLPHILILLLKYRQCLGWRRDERRCIDAHQLCTIPDIISGRSL